MEEKNYKQLCQHFEDIYALKHAIGILYWDEQTTMPRGVEEERAFVLSKLNKEAHEKLIHPKILEIADKVNQKNLGVLEKRNLSLMIRAHKKAIVLPSSFVEAKSKLFIESEQAWPKMRKSNDFKSYAPILEKVVATIREEASIRAQADGLLPYDALMDLYERGVKVSDLNIWFGPLKKNLPDLIKKAHEFSKKRGETKSGPFFDPKVQEQLGREIMKDLNFDFSRGRLDISTHPFCGGASPDVRITTRYKEDNFDESLMGIVHETGHALYEQNLPKEFIRLPVGEAVGMTVHESQSLFMEMQVGRSEEFLSFLLPKLKRYFPSHEALWKMDELKKMYYQVKPDYIRVCADEVTYGAHILLRTELEQEFIGGKLEVRHLPERWNEAMKYYLGIETLGNDKDGCLQDVHWPMGAMGYFPSYLLGAMFGAQLGHTFKQQNSTWQSDWALGDFTKVQQFLRDKIWSKGSLVEMKELVTLSTGEELNAKFLLAHLQKRYLS